MAKVMLIGDNGVGQDVEMIANYGDGGVLVEFHSGQRKLVARNQVDFDYFAEENKIKKFPEWMIQPGPVVPIFGKEDVKKSYPDLELLDDNVDHYVESVDNPRYTPREIEEEVAAEELAVEGSLDYKALYEGTATKFTEYIDKLAQAGKELAELKKHNEYLIEESKESAEIIEYQQKHMKKQLQTIKGLRDDVDRLGKYLVKVILKNNRA